MHHTFHIPVGIEIIVVKVDDVLTRGPQNRHISFGTHGEVLTHWTFDRNVFQTLVHAGNALKKGGRLIVVSLYHHQLLVWPTLIHKTLPQLWVESCPRCRSGGHYRDSAHNFSNRLVKLMQTDAFHGLQLSFQGCQVFWHSRWNVGNIWTNRLTHGVHKLHQSHQEEGLEDRKLWRKPPQEAMKLDPKCWLLWFQKKKLTRKKNKPRNQSFYVIPV